MKVHLLAPAKHFYKANLHSHTVFSDGNWSPEQMKEEYKKRGYSILACSDHEHLRDNSALTDADFLMLTAYEISFRDYDDPRPHSFRPVVDLNLFAKKPNETRHIGLHPDAVRWLVEKGCMTQDEFDAIEYVDGLRDLHYYPANINRVIRSANENGYLVSINHPMWSLTNAADYCAYEGAWAVEVYNHGCHECGLSDSEAAYEDILRSGKNIFAIATDDNHNGNSPDPYWDSFGGFTMIGADSLEYEAVISAMERGYFYASCGPEFYELYYENGMVHVECSPCREISMITLGRQGKLAKGKNGELIESADFQIDPELYGYVRFRLRDSQGRAAYTNAYYVDDFMEGAHARRAVL